MSEKQFKIINELGDYHLLDGDEELCYDLCSSAMAKENWDNVVEKLNELNTEREYLIGERGKLETKNVLLRKENEQLRLELETHKHPLWSTREAEKKVNKLADSLADEVKKNGLLNEEINQLRIENMRLKKKGGDEMCKQTCGTCKHFHLDGMFGFWCEKGHDWTLVNGNCSDFER